MAIKIAITNAKGGVGKTTTAVCLADALMYVGYDVLFLDLDPQMNSSKVYTGENDISEAKTLKNLIKGDNVNNCITKTDFGDIILGDQSLADEEDTIYQMARKNLGKLRKSLEKIEDNYDFIMIDTPPNVGTWMRSALYAADGIVIPFNAKTFAVDGLGWLLETIDKIKESGNPNLKIYGGVLTFYDRRNRQDREIAKALPALGKALKFHTFSTHINTCQDIENTIAEGVSLFRSKGNSTGAVDYVHLLHELLKEV